MFNMISTSYFVIYSGGKTKILLNLNQNENVLAFMIGRQSSGQKLPVADYWPDTHSVPEDICSLW